MSPLRVALRDQVIKQLSVGLSHERRQQPQGKTCSKQGPGQQREKQSSTKCVGLTLGQAARLSRFPQNRVFRPSCSLYVRIIDNTHHGTSMLSVFFSQLSWLHPAVLSLVHVQHRDYCFLFQSHAPKLPSECCPSAGTTPPARALTFLAPGKPSDPPRS